MPDLHRQLFLLYRDQGDISALGKLFDELSAELFRLALYLSPDASDAEDLVQNTFLSAIESQKGYDESRPLRPWLTGILANLARRRRRDLGRGRPSPIPEGLTASTDTDVVGAAERDELRTCLRGALQSLPQPYRQVLTLHLEEGMTARRIGEVMERPAGTVRSQIVRGLDLLRKSLPAGVTGGLSYILASGHALAGVRVEVLRAATDMAPAAPASSTSSTATALRWTLPHSLAAAAIILAGVAAIWWPEADPVAPPPRASTETAAGQVATSAGDEAPTTKPLATDNEAPSRVLAPSIRKEARVRLVDEDGHPQAGLSCRVVNSEDPSKLFALACLVEDFALAKSGPDGWVTVETGSAKSYVLWVVGTNLRRRLADAPNTKGVTWELPRLHPFEGEVHSENGTLLAGVNIFASKTAGSMEVNAPLTQTGPDGAFRLLLPTSHCYVWAAGNGVRSAATPTRGRAIKLTAVAAAASIEITVTTPGRGPVAGAFVGAFFEATDGALRPPMFARTDQAGSARLTGLPAGKVIVTARSGDRTATRRELNLNGSASYPAALQLHEGARVTGQVLDFGGNPVRDCVVFAQAPQLLANSFDGRLLDRFGVTDDEGRYLVTGLSQGDVRLRLTQRQQPREFANDSIKLTAGEQRQLDWQINKRVLKGRVTGLSNPAAFTVTAAPADPSGRAFSRARYTEAIGPDGTFAMLLPPRASSVALHVAPTGNPAPLIYYCARAVVDDISEPIELTVRPQQARYVTLKLRLTDEQDRGAKVSLRRGQQTTYSSMDDQGFVTFADVVAGDYSLRIERDNGLAWTRAVLISGEQSNVELTDLEARPQGVLTVVCRRAARLTVQDARGFFVTAITPATPTPLESGSYTLSAYGPDVAPQTAQVTIQAGKETQHAIDSEQGLRCDFELFFDPVDNNRDVNADLRIALFDQGGALVVKDNVKLVVDGAYRWSQKLKPGEYRVKASSSWGGIASGIAVVSGDAPMTWQAKLKLQ
jgi:RNA polymerase sigma-70 factor, ECF subfamily